VNSTRQIANLALIGFMGAGKAIQYRSLDRQIWG
jgi:shikimate kinase